MMVTKFQLTASECIFFDDNISNILIAKELGINAILFTDIQEALRFLGCD